MQRVTTAFFASPNRLIMQGEKNFKAKQFSQAIECYNQVLKESEIGTAYYDETAYYNRAKAYYNLGKYDEALTSLETVSRSVGTEIFFILGEIYYQKGDYDNSIFHYSEVILHAHHFSDQPDCLINSYLGLGNSHYAMQQYDKAIDAYDHYLELDSYNVSVCCDRGLAYLKTKQYDKAIADFNHALEMAATDWIIYGYLGNAYYEKEQYVEALQAYRACLKYDHSNYHAMSRVNELSYLQQDSAVLTHQAQEKLIVKIVDINTDTDITRRTSHLVEEALFDTISAYRLKNLELAFVEKQMPLLLATKACLQCGKKILGQLPKQLESIANQITKTDNTLNSLSNPQQLRKKINDYLAYLHILYSLKTTRWVAEADLLQLKKIDLYKALVAELETMPSTTLSACLPLSSSEMSPVEWIVKLEAEFVEQAKEKIKNCKNRYELSSTLSRIGWLREDSQSAEFSYDNKLYRGDLIEKISFKFLRDNKGGLNTYTSQLGIRSKVQELWNNHKQCQDDIAQKKQQINKEYEIAYQAFLAVQQRFFDSKRQLKEEKIQKSSVAPFIKQFRSS
ncbi:MAG: tetratricopeptide repeat protein [Gammaproteobacteria bacterium]|nr:tetratricopeptide repeat protein [Gammaproteobacteria bacterium]MCW5582597.1 tetratricopeptide repeat protein [Gammaproteobacteria bacterium]